MRTTGAVARRWITMTAFAWAAAARGGESATWLDAAADAPIDHSVMVRGPLVDLHGKVDVTGPVGLVATGPDRDDAALHAVYRVVGADGDGPPAGTVFAADAPLRLGPVEFLIVPAKRLVDGRPAAAAPPGVYEARRILDAPESIAVTPAAGRPTHLCLPVEYRHHFERVPVEDAGRGLLLFAPRGAEPAAMVGIVDDFGINRLRPGGAVRDAAWVAVRLDADR